jgi:Leucine-rich repeat (LRR) protein
MTSIVFSYNNLTEITPQIGLLGTLKEFHCSNNEIGVVEIVSLSDAYRTARLEKLPAEIGRLAHLDILVCTNNRYR